MPILHLILATTIALAAPQDCTDWHECRDLAVAAAGNGDYETFHDLAWRAVQKGPKNDPALMLLLARAQALSGRPGDAFVMLDRLAERGVAVDAATDPDFLRVRALPGWPDLDRRLAAATAAPAPATPAGKSDSKGLDAAAPPAPPSTRPVRADVREEAAGAAPVAAAPAMAEPVEALRFPESGLAPDGLAYDGVSRRFLVADRHARKLSVVDEFSQRVATLAGAQADFGEIEALEIDPHAGDLWVVTAEPAAAGGATTLHKLQLVSGRVLATFRIAAPAHFVDVAVGAGASILVLDATGRILRLNRNGLEFAAPVPPGSTGIAPADEGIAYVSTSDGLTRVDLSSRTVLPVVPPDGHDLSNLTHVRWYRGMLIAVQHHGTGARILRLRLSRSGRAVVAIDPIDTIHDPAGAIAIAGGTLYYFASQGDGEVVLKKVPL